MNLDFCCDVQMVGSEFGISIITPGPNLPYVHSSGWWWWWWRWWHNGVGNVSLVPTESLYTRKLKVCVTWYDHVHPFLATIYTS